MSKNTRGVDWKRNRFDSQTPLLEIINSDNKILPFFISAVHSREEELSKPFLIPSHYGGQVVFPMTCGNLIYLHLKDKQKIRHRKRWSQVRHH